MKFFASLAAILVMASTAKADVEPMVTGLMAKELYYAEGRQHPGSLLYGSHEGLWASLED